LPKVFGLGNVGPAFIENRVWVSRPKKYMEFVEIYDGFYLT